MDGQPYVLLPRDEYDRLTTLAKAAELPPLPKPDADGNYPAVEYARASLARKIIRDRAAAGLTQRELAKLAGISFEHLCRIETGKHVPSVPTIDKIDRALRQASKPTRKGAKKGRFREVDSHKFGGGSGGKTFFRHGRATARAGERGKVN